MFNPIVLIPTYNHHIKLLSIIEQIKNYGINILIIDDGSDETTKKALIQIKEATDADLLTLNKNRGKGAAIKAGVRYVQNQNYSHCIQIDADGQHDIDDLPSIISLARKYPGRMILGNPVFDLLKAPKSRIWGRKISNFWIALETMSLQIKDGLNGYRCYPIDEVIKVIDNVKTSDRMEFDPEILIRLRWQGVNVCNFDTKVSYGQKESSNFDMLLDNIGISFMFMRLFWAGVGRLIFRKRTYENQSENWMQTKERGNGFLIYLTYFLYKLLKKRLTLIMLQPVMLYFYFTDKKGRNASKKYLDKIYKNGSSKLLLKPGLVSSFMHYNCFCSSLLDKVGIRIPGKRKEFSFSYSGYDEIEKLFQNKQGAIFIGAHLGNFDVLHLLAKEPQIKLKMLMYRQHAQMINGLFSRMKSQNEDSIIEIDTINVATAGMLYDYVNEGGFLGILGDRIPSGSKNRILRLPFLGEEASFPQGPWIIAGLLKCPVIFFYAVSAGQQKYEIHFKKLFEEVNISSGNRENEIKKYLARYISKLEDACCRFPYQWFNFYNFWQKED